MTHRFRIDSSNGVFRRNEIDVTVGTKQTYLTVGYAYLNRNIMLEDLTDLQEVRPARAWPFALLVGVRLGDHRPDDEVAGADDDNQWLQPIRHRIGVQYEDECFRFGVTWRRDYISDRDFRAGDSYPVHARLQEPGALIARFSAAWPMLCASR